jgi:hypothetical protein
MWRRADVCVKRLSQVACGISLLGVLAISGCSIFTGSTLMPDPSASPAEATATAAPFTPGPGGVDSGWIASRVPAWCSDLLSVSSVSSVLGVPESIVVPFIYPLADGSAAERQAGKLDCYWALTDQPEDERQASMTVEILPDAANDFHRLVHFEGPGNELLGRDSDVWCTVDEGYLSCYAMFEHNGYWVEFSYDIAAPKNTKTSIVIAQAKQLGETLITALDAAGEPLPPYEPPAGYLTAWSSCEVLDNGTGFRSAVNSPSLDRGWTAPIVGPSDLFETAYERADLEWCQWVHDNDDEYIPPGQLRQLTVEIIPGGGWAWPSLSRGSLVLDGAAEVTIAGTDAALIYCFDGTDCTVEALVKHSYLKLNLYFDSVADGDARSTAIIAMEYILRQLR